MLVASRLDKCFDYITPAGGAPRAGSYVRVPFGRQECIGVVWEGEASSVDVVRLKPVAEHYAHLPPLSEAMRRFVDWVAWYNCAPRGAVLKMVVPVEDALAPPSSRERVKPVKHPESFSAANVPLSPAQREAADAVMEASANGFSALLLDGVTGSGKTEVYFDAIARLLEKPQAQVLVMLPEIALSVQWLERFEKRFGFEPVVWHSNISPAKRKAAWRAIASGDARVVVGARSALFLPYAHLRLIVVDEEHDTSYKQEEGVMYQARDMAVARARCEKIPVLLASATPSLESWVNVQQGRYRLLHLPNRHGGAQLPAVHLIDMRKAECERGSFLSRPLRDALAKTVAAGGQAMLFLNRRGYAPLVLCRACGTRIQCPSCTAWMVLHRTRPRLQCHHCGYQSAVPKTCASCGAEESLHPCGPGVEKIAEEVKESLPQLRYAVLSSDVTDNVEALRDVIHAMQEQRLDLLIGTQMIAKGHHFAKLALVGVVDADLGLAGGDLRAAEHTYQLLHQVAGRAGREKQEGEVWLQSFMPEHPVMQALIAGERDRFLQMEAQSRRDSHMPPFARLVAVIIEGKSEAAARAYAEQLGRVCPQIFGLRVLGPAPAPLSLLRGYYRFRLLVVAERALNVQQVAAEWLGRCKAPSSLKVKLDVDPYSFL